MSHKLEVGERRSLASHYTLTTACDNTKQNTERFESSSVSGVNDHVVVVLCVSVLHGAAQASTGGRTAHVR